MLSEKCTPSDIVSDLPLPRPDGLFNVGELMRQYRLKANELVQEELIRQSGVEAGLRLAAEDKKEREKEKEALRADAEPKAGERNYCQSPDCIRERNRLASERQRKRLRGGYWKR